MTTILRQIVIFLMTLFICSETYTQACTPLEFYKSLVENVESSEGRMVLYLNKGVWNATVRNKKFVVNTDNSTSSTKMSVIFKYANGKIVSVRVDFIPAIHIYIATNKCASLGMSSLTYDGDGDVIDHKANWDNPKCVSPEVDKLYSFFEFATTFDKLGMGKPFRNSDALKFSGSAEQGNLPFVYRIRFTSNENENHALLVNLKDGATIFFQRNPTDNSFVKLVSPSFFSFKEIDYDVLSNDLEGELEDFNVVVDRGQLSNKHCNLLLSSNTSIKLNSIVFKKSIDEAYVNAESGAVHCNLAKGTYLVLYSDPRPNRILFDNGSYGDLVGFKMQFFDNLQNNLIQFESGSIFNIKVEDAVLSFGQKGFLQIVNSDISANLSCIFSSKNKPNVSGIIKNFDALINAGEFIPNSESDLILGKGNISANSLTINSAEVPFVTGVLSKFDVSVLENSKFNIPGGFNMLVGPNGRINMNNPLSPLRLDIDNIYPYGELELDMPIKSFTNGLTDQFIVRNGTFNAKVEHKANGSIVGSDINVAGDVLFSLPKEIGGKQITLRVSINDGTLIKNLRQKPSFDAWASVVIPAGNSVRYVTPRLTPDDRTIVFPTSLDVSFHDPININRQHISFDGTNVIMNFSTNAVLDVFIPNGGGQHDIDHGDIFDGGPDDLKTWQEVVRYDIKDPCGVAHIYLEPGKTYTFDLKFDLVFDNSGFNPSLSNMMPRQAISWKRDGGGGVCPFLVGIIAGFILGPDFAVPAFVAANVIANETADNMINSFIYAFLTKYKPKLK